MVKLSPDDYIDYPTESTLPLPATEKGDGKPGKEKKKKAKELSDRLKLNMANERTFTKWIMTGMQMGAIGTFILINLDRHHNTLWGVSTLAFAWVVGFLIALYGVFGYYGRRRALLSGEIEKDPAMGRALVPMLIMIGLVAVVGTSLSYVGIAGLPAHPPAATTNPKPNVSTNLTHRR